MNNVSYKIGQVLYVVSAKNAAVVPVQVIEKRISETVDGTMVKHIIKGPTQNSKPQELELLNGIVYADVQQVRQMMMKNAMAAIDKMVINAAELAAKAFAVKQSIIEHDDIFNEHSSEVHEAPSHPNIPIEGPTDVDDGTTEIMLPNGQMQRVRVKNAS